MASSVTTVSSVALQGTSERRPETSCARFISFEKPLKKERKERKRSIALGFRAQPEATAPEAIACRKGEEDMLEDEI